MSLGLVAALLTRKLLAGNPEGNLRPVRRRDEGAGLLGSRQAGRHVPEGDGVGADAEGRAPFFGDGAGEADDAGFGDGVVGLAAATALVLLWSGSIEVGIRDEQRRKIHTHCRESHSYY